MTPQLAAGVGLWRRAEGGVEVLLVERTKHRDLSLPKGKLDPGEALPECAVRELEEETGYRATLQAPLGTSEYRLPTGQDKVVYYWMAQLRAEAPVRAFAPNDEIRALHWLPLDEAVERSTYAHDAVLLRRLAERIATGEADTFAIVALRHAKAADPYVWEGDDASRPLTSRGERQARQVAPSIAAFGVERILVSTAVRCRQTVEPLSRLVDVPPKPVRSLAQDTYLGRGDRLLRRVESAVRRRRPTVLCSHLPVVPAVVDAVASATASPDTPALHRGSMLHTADFTVLHVGGPDGRIVAVETHGAPH
ncbi:NUDIX hydrolase [Agrococcus sp. SGAir0287]|uniref:NUDIX hydrolase n=1 Tax=Agrococcus sp. SGAir0287 TaxID=2070347 RepID=UPI001586C44E|nr:NUDIX domain-containing protein [Agrococcus sp. SGAir0287]